MKDLEKARRVITETDEEMVKLFEKRMDAVHLVAEYKKEHGLPILDASREKSIINKHLSEVQNEEYRSYYVNFLKNTIELSKQYQSKILDGMRVAYSGVEGAFASIVAKRIFPDSKTISCSDFVSAYRAVEEGTCDCALLPIENSFNGDVGKVLDLAFFGSLYISGVYEAEIIQNLLGVPGTTIDEIRTVISHPQALGQCSSYIEEHNFETVEAINTAVAAKQVAEMGKRDVAAIGSVEAAEQYGLQKIDSHINESNQNTTRFAVFSRAQRLPSKDDNRFIMLFTVNNTAGSLGKAVSVIGEHGFNLRALKSRPTKDLIWEYYFYVEGEGNINSSEGEAMLTQLKECCSQVKILGSYEKEFHV